MYDQTNVHACHFIWAQNPQQLWINTPGTTNGHASTGTKTTNHMLCKLKT